MGVKINSITSIAVFLFLAVILSFTASAQSTSPTIGDGEVQIVCDNDYYLPDVYGNIQIYCNITNVGKNAKNHKVGATFDDFINKETELNDVLTNSGTGWKSIKPDMNKDKLSNKKTKQLSQQSIQTKSGETTQIVFDVKVPFGSHGKFDVMYGDDIYVLDPWWNVTWQYKYNYTLHSHTENLTNYPVNLTMNTKNLIANGKMKPDCSDIRVLNSSEDGLFAYFVRNCNTSDSEIWFKDNFTLGTNNTYYVYYGYADASNTMADPYDIVYMWEDFNNASAFNYSLWMNRSIHELATGRSAPQFFVADGIAKIVTGDTSSGSGNFGYYFWKADQDINMSVGMLVDVEYWYDSDNGMGWGRKPPIAIRNKNYYAYQTPNYAWLDSNHTSFIINYISIYDTYAKTGYSNGTDYFAIYNSSDLYSADGQWTKNVYTFDPTTLEAKFYMNYTGSALEELIFDSNWSVKNNSIFDWDFLENHLSFNNVIEFGVSDGAANTQNRTEAAYNYVFARPYTPNEPKTTIGSEIPLNNATLEVNYTTPTPVNGSTLSYNNITINVTSNKTIESCTLELNGVNESMTLDTNYCYIDKNLSNGNYTYTIYVQDYWTYINATEERSLTISTAPTITIYSPATYVYTTQSIPLNVSADTSISTWLYSINSSANTTFTPNTTLILSEGTHQLEVYANNSANEWGYSSVLFDIDTTITGFAVLSPTNTSYSSLPIPYNITYSESNITITYSIDSGTNQSFTGNTTLTNLTEETHCIETYATDSYANYEYDNTCFTFTYSIPTPVTGMQTVANSILYLIPAILIIISILLVLTAFQSGELDLRRLITGAVILLIAIIFSGVIFTLMI